jgi:hypothetical protein
MITAYMIDIRKITPIRGEMCGDLLNSDIKSQTALKSPVSVKLSPRSSKKKALSRDTTPIRLTPDIARNLYHMSKTGNPSTKFNTKLNESLARVSNMMP